MNDIDRAAAPSGGEMCNRLDIMSAVTAQVALNQAGEHRIFFRKQCSGNMGKQQVAEIVAIEGAKQDGGNSGQGIVDHTCMISPLST